MVYKFKEYIGREKIRNSIINIVDKVSKEFDIPLILYGSIAKNSFSYVVLNNKIFILGDLDLIILKKFDVKEILNFQQYLIKKLKKENIHFIDYQKIDLRLRDYKSIIFPPKRIKYYEIKKYGIFINTKIKNNYIKIQKREIPKEDYLLYFFNALFTYILLYNKVKKCNIFSFGKFLKIFSELYYGLNYLNLTPNNNVIKYHKIRINFNENFSKITKNDIILSILDAQYNIKLSFIEAMSKIYNIKFKTFEQVIYFFENNNNIFLKPFLEIKFSKNIVKLILPVAKLFINIKFRLFDFNLEKDNITKFYTESLKYFNRNEYNQFKNLFLKYRLILMKFQEI